MKNENRGTSLIELIFVMAILAVLACSVGLGINLVSGRPAEQCASKLKSMIQNNRVTTMGKFDSWLTIYSTPTGGVAVLEYIKQPDGTTPTPDPVVLVRKDVTLQYMIDNDGTYIPLGGILTPLIIGFDRSSGAFKDLSDMGLSGKYCTEIIVSKGNTVKTLKLSSLTGKISLD